MPVERPDVHASARPAMGGMANIVTDASPVAAEVAHRIIADLEVRWSRFLPTSELHVASERAGPCVVSPPTAEVIQTALAGSRLTDGWYDPTFGREHVAADSNRSLTTSGWAPRWASRRPRRRERVRIDSATGVLDLPAGVALDLRGVGKGWAADAAATLLFEHGAAYAGVELGGDIRVRSRHRAVVEIAHPGTIDRPARLGLKDGGVAVSGPMRRRTADGRHHLIDPTTAGPAEQPRLAMVVAASAAGAEILATASAIAPLDVATRILDRVGATAWLIEADGSLAMVGTPERFLLDEGWLERAARREWTR